MSSASGKLDKPKKTRQQRSYGKTRKKLLDAAKTVMAEKGLSATTVEDITDRADVGRGSFYYHFDAKDEMIRLMMEKLLKELVAALREGCAPHTEINAVLDAMIGTHIKFFSNRWEDFVLYYQGRADIMLDESLEGIETPFLIYLSCIEELIEGALSKPISKERLRRLAYALAGFISGYYSFASVASEEDDLDGSFMALRSAFVVSLARFIKEALP
jgi:AcrR family transcriptional regulator